MPSSSSSICAAPFCAAEGRAFSVCFWTCVEKNVYRLGVLPFSIVFPLPFAFSGLVLALLLPVVERLRLGRYAAAAVRERLLVSVDCDLVGVRACFTVLDGLTNGEASSMGEEFRAIGLLFIVAFGSRYSSSSSSEAAAVGGGLEGITLRFRRFVGGAIEAMDIEQSKSLVCNLGRSDHGREFMMFACLGLGCLVDACLMLAVEPRAFQPCRVRLTRIVFFFRVQQ